MTDTPRITCTSPAKELAIEYFLSAPIKELTTEMFRLSSAPFHHSCERCMRVALQISAMRLLDSIDTAEQKQETVLERLAQ